MKTLREALKDWSWLRNLDDMEIVRTSCIGDVILRTASGEEFILDVVGGELRAYDEHEKYLLNGESNLMGRMEQHGLTLSPGTCYCLKPHAIFEVHKPDNVYVGTTSEYVSFLGDFHNRVKDLPDGTKVRFVVKS